jgi:catechol 2,3-dioxygenase-like lactoylglutathione lyase family enzyme
MKDLLVCKVIVFVPDLRAAEEFYAEILGLELRDKQNTFMRLQSGHITFDIFQCEHSSDVVGYSSRAGAAVAFSVQSISDAMCELRGKGVKLLHEVPNDAPDGSRYVAFADPFGTVFELVECRHDGNSA